jgi:small neutral amino acid transporter SnatA (MarC family)
MVLAGARTLTAMLGGFAIAKGWITSDQVTQISGAIVVLATSGFALYSQYHNKQNIKTALAMEPPAAQAATEPASTPAAQPEGASS